MKNYALLFRIGLGSLGLGLLASQFALADTLYTISADPNAGFVPQALDSIDTTGKSVSSPFTLGNGTLGFTGGLAYRGNNNTFYVISQDNSGNSVFNSFTLAGGPPVSPLFTLGQGFTGGLTFDTANGFFYAVNNDSVGNSSLYRIDTSGGGSATPLFALGTGFTGGLAFDSANGLLYGISNDSGGNSTLDSISLGGVVTPLALSLGQGFTGGLAYGPGSGLFYAISSDSLGNSSLSDFTLASSSPTSLFGVSVGTNNAALTLGPAGPAPVVPEPSTMLLVGSGLVGAAYLLKFRNRAKELAQ